MVSEIRIYVEGGGDGKDTKAEVRKGFSQFFKDLQETAKKEKIGFQIIACGGRDLAYRDFRNALKSHPDACNILLVDSEDYIRVSSPKQHLTKRDPSWDMSGIAEDRIHLMVQVMESWLIADVKALANFYGQGFQESSIPGNLNVEDIPKTTVESSLKKATQNSQKKVYHKIQHGPKILGMLDVAIVRSKASYCDRLFATLIDKMKQ